MTAWFRSLFPGASSPPPSRNRVRQTDRNPDWMGVLEFRWGPPPSLDLVEERFRRLAAASHPDRGGSTNRMQRLNWARSEARKHLAS